MAHAAQSTGEHADAAQKLGKMIKGIKIAMLTTADTAGDGSLRSRPMATQEAEFDGTLWFFTYNASGKVDEVRHDQHVNLSYADPSDNRYVSVSGRGSISRDKAKIKELWTPALKAWFPKGQNDPDIALLKVDVDAAEYWDSPSSTVVKVAGFIKAVATGQRYEPGDNQKLDMHKNA